MGRRPGRSAGDRKATRQHGGARVSVDRLSEEFAFFKTLSADELRDFVAFCEPRSVEAGEVLWREGDEHNDAAFILSGEIVIKKNSRFEKGVVVGIFSRGTVVGELCLLTGEKRSVTAQVREPGELLVISSQRFEELIATHPLLGLKLLKKIFQVVTKRLSCSYERIASIF